MVDKIARSIEASRILESELTREAFAKLEAQYIKAWRDGRTVEAREDAHRYVTLLGKFEQHFKSLITTGEIEAKAQKELEGRAGWASRFRSP